MLAKINKVLKYFTVSKTKLCFVLNIKNHNVVYRTVSNIKKGLYFFEKKCLYFDLIGFKTSLIWHKYEDDHCFSISLTAKGEYGSVKSLCHWIQQITMYASQLLAAKDKLKQSSSASSN